MSHQDKRNHRVKCHFGKEDYYKHYKKTSKNPLSKELWNAILMDYLSGVSELISQKGMAYTMPSRMGLLEIRKAKREVSIDKDGNVKNTFHINWKATKELWATNERARDEKIKIRYVNKHTDGYSFEIKYIKNLATYKNKSVYKMMVNREMRRSMAKPIINKELDAFLIKTPR